MVWGYYFCCFVPPNQLINSNIDCIAAHLNAGVILNGGNSVALDIVSTSSVLRSLDPRHPSSETTRREICLTNQTDPPRSAKQTKRATLIVATQCRYYRPSALIAVNVFILCIEFYGVRLKVNWANGGDFSVVYRLRHRLFSASC